MVPDAGHVERSSRRKTQRIPVVLLMKKQGQEFQHSGSTVDVSAEGVKVRTTAGLSEGEVVYVSCRGYAPLGYSRVVWVRGSADHALRNEVGLRLMNGRRADHIRLVAGKGA